jgi:2-dehydropantoate 2-reductase
MNAIKHKPSASLSHDSATTLVDGVSDTFESLQLFVSQVIEDTKHNKSSMYQDILNNRQTEISQLNGFVVQKGKDVGVNCGANEDLTIRIKELEPRQKEQRQSL